MDNVNVSTTGQVTFIHKRHVLFILQSFLVTSLSASELLKDVDILSSFSTVCNSFTMT